MRYLSPFTLALVFLFSASHAAAAEPSVGSGTVSFGPPGPPQISYHGGNQFVSIVLPSTLSGTLAGTGVESLTAERHPNGTETFQAWNVMQATVDGRTGEVVIRIVGTGANGTNSGHITIVSASGDLTGLHGEGTFTGTDAGATYTIMYSLSP